MRWIIMALFIVPIIEVMLFVTIGAEIGLWATLGIIIATAAIGSWLLNLHGRGLPQRIQHELQSNGFPAQSLFEGLCLGVAAIFLMTPGFFTDAVGFSLFVPTVRRLLFGFLSRRMTPFAFQNWQSNGGFSPDNGNSNSHGSGPIIDGESDPASSDGQENRLS